jgi:ABC-type glycerol-3-phosphate transport system substrate-binding protein
MRGFRTLTLVILAALMLVSCAQATPQVVVQTQVVEKEVVKEVVQTQVVEKEVVKEITAIPVRSDGLPEYTGGPAEIRIGWWGNDDRAARTLQVIQLFQEAYPEIKVIGEPNGGTADHFQIIDTQLAGNNAPDIFQLGGNWPDYQQYLEPLNGYLGQQLMIDTP